VTTPFDLYLFSTDAKLVAAAVQAGLTGAVVDWEYVGKERRQASADTQINRDSPEDLQRLRAFTRARLLCRINAFGPGTAEEVEQAAGAGADEILLPMVQRADEVLRLLDIVRGRLGVGILIETRAAVAQAAELGALPLTRVYFGLNDFAIETGAANIFRAVADGTVEQVRSKVVVPFGFAGVTLPDRGSPIPCRLLIGEMMRIGSGFSFLRRSFMADCRGGGVGDAVLRISEALGRARLRAPGQVEADHAELLERIGSAAPAGCRRS